MAGLFKNNYTQQEMSQRELLESKYKNSTHNLLIVAIFTLINVVLLIAQSNTYFLFSASIPYALVDFAMFFCGRYPEEVYYGMADVVFLDNTFFVIAVVLAALIILLYFLSWLFAKKNKIGWMIFALVFFALDTVAMLAYYGINADMIVDIVFHAWVLISLATGISNYYKLKKLPVEVVEEAVEEIEAPVVEETAETVE